MDAVMTDDELRVRAAHERIERELARLLAASPAGPLTLRSDGGMSYPFGRQVKSVNWADLERYWEGMKRSGLVASIEAAYPQVIFTLSDAGRAALRGSDFFRLMLDRDYIRNPRPQRTPVPAQKAVTAAIAETLFERGACKHGTLLGWVTLRLEVPQGATADRQDFPKRFRRIFDSSIDSLLRDGTLTRKGKQLDLSVPARERRKRGYDGTPIVMPPVVQPPAVRPPAVRPAAQSPAVAMNLKLRSKSTEELVAMWKSAVAIVGNPIRRPQHAEAERVIFEVTKEWERRAGEMAAGRFPWPSTAANSGNGRLTFESVQSEGMLAFMEYRVGRVNGEPEGVRRAILQRMFESTLPPAFPKAYMAEWGGNGSAARLQKMAFSIAAFVRNVKRRRVGDFTDAITEWESDLSWLRKTYYVNKFRFALGWPETAI